MALVPEKMNDTEWRLACEELAKEDIALAKMRGDLDEQAEDWKATRKGFESAIETAVAKVVVLARQVDTKTRMVEQQGDLPLDE